MCFKKPLELNIQNTYRVFSPATRHQPSAPSSSPSPSPLPVSRFSSLFHFSSDNDNDLRRFLRGKVSAWHSLASLRPDRFKYPNCRKRGIQMKPATGGPPEDSQILRKCQGNKLIDIKFKFNRYEEIITFWIRINIWQKWAFNFQDPIWSDEHRFKSWIRFSAYNLYKLYYH